jgi:hypothetical protein
MQSDTIAGCSVWDDWAVRILLFEDVFILRLINPCSPGTPL